MYAGLQPNFPKWFEAAQLNPDSFRQLALN